MISFKSFLYEGGWSNTITQGVKLTPAVTKKALSMMPKFEKDFNAFLAKQGAEPIEIGSPVGSSAYVERDLKDNPTKEYGDIDIIMKIPRVGGMTDSQVNSYYSNLVKQFVADPPSYIFKDDKNGGQNVIIKSGEDWVQVDLVKAIKDVADWVQWRMTPEHNVKGALTGYLYSSLAEFLNLSIGSLGVQAKEKEGAFVSFRTVKVDKTHTLTVDIEHFALDILKKLAERAGVKSVKVDPLLKANPGMKKGDIKTTTLANAIKGLGKSFALNDMFGKGDLKHVKDYDEFIERIKDTYVNKAEEAARGTKFDKAETPEAKQRAEDTKKLLVTKSKEIVRYLD
jgi:hypothetical protein